MVPGSAHTPRASRTDRSEWIGPLVTVGAAMILAVLGTTRFEVPNPSAILLATVAFAVLSGGARAGLASAAIGIAYLLLELGPLERPVHYSAAEVRRLVAYGVAAPVIVLLGGRMRALVDRLYLRERQARLRAERAERRSAFLSEASRLLGLSLNYPLALKSVARLAVETLADWCAVYTTGDRGRRPRLEVAHANPAMERHVTTLYREWERAGFPRLIADAVDARRPLLLQHVSPEVRAGLAEAPRARSALAELELTSAMVVPLIARGAILGSITFAADGTRRRYTETDLELAQELARRAALAIDNAQLFQAALDADRAKTNFLAVVSHELRTPLTAIIGYADLLAEELPGPLNPRQRTEIERLRSNADQLLGLVDRILDYARLGIEPEEAEIESFDFFALVRDTADEFRGTATGKGLGYLVTVPARERIILSDPAKLRQILRALITNAVNFTQRGRVSLEAESEDAYVAVRVMDTGPGIPPELQDRIFEPFAQVEAPNIRRVGGAGLGLSLARRLAHLLGGEITLRTEPGRGSTFTVRIPVLPVGATEDTDTLPDTRGHPESG